jgi:hypothetical protein
VGRGASAIDLGLSADAVAETGISTLGMGRKHLDEGHTEAEKQGGQANCLTHPSKPFISHLGQRAAHHYV